MKKAKSILLVIALILTVFVSCNGDVDERLFEDHEHYYEIKSDGHWECIRPNCNLPNKLLAGTDKPYITVVVDGQPTEIIPLTGNADVGKGTLTVEGSEITYANTSGTAQEVVIRTNSEATTLKIVDTTDSKIYQYDDCGIIEAEVGMNSLYIEGHVNFVEAKAGHIVANGLVDAMFTSAASLDNVKVEGNVTHAHASTEAGAAALNASTVVNAVTWDYDGDNETTNNHPDLAEGTTTIESLKEEVASNSINEQFLSTEGNENYVARIGQVGYMSLDDAITACETDAKTIVILKDIKDDFDISKFKKISEESTSYKYYTCYEISVDANIILNLNGHTIDTWTKDSAEASTYIPSGCTVNSTIETRTFEVYGNFTVIDNSSRKNGKINNPNTGYRSDYAIYAREGSKISLKSGTVYAEGAYGMYLDKVASFDMSGGSIIGGYYALFINGTSSSEAPSIIKINDGEVLTKFSEETAQIGHYSTYDWSQMPPTEVFQYYIREYKLIGYALQTYYNVDVSISNATIGYVAKNISDSSINSKIDNITKYQYSNDVDNYGPATSENTIKKITIEASAISINVNADQVAKFKVESSLLMNYERENDSISEDNLNSFNPFDYISYLIYNVDQANGVWTITKK